MRTLALIICLSALRAWAQPFTMADPAWMAQQKVAVSGGGSDGSNGDTKAITAAGGGTLENDLTYLLGMQITVGASPITVTTMGRWVVAGNSGSHTISIYDSAGLFIQSTSVNLSGATAGRFQYATITATTLSATETYYILSSETNGGDQWYNVSTVTPASGFTVIDSAYSSDGGATVHASGVGANKDFVPVTFQFH